MKKTSKILAMLLSFVMIISFATAGFADVSLTTDKSEENLFSKTITFDESTTLPADAVKSGTVAVSSDYYHGSNGGNSVKIKAGGNLKIYFGNGATGLTEAVESETDITSAKAVEIKYYIYYPNKEYRKSFYGTLCVDGEEDNSSRVQIQDNGPVYIGADDGVKVDEITCVNAKWHEVKYICDFVNDIIWTYINGVLVYTKNDANITALSYVKVNPRGNYSDYLYIDDITVTEKNEYVLLIDDFVTEDTDSIQNTVKNIDVSLRGYPHVDSYVTKGSDNDVDFYAIGNVSGGKTIVNKASLPKYIKVFGYDKKGNLVIQSQSYNTENSDFVKSRNLVFAKDSWTSLETNYFNYDDTYFATCAKIEATTDASDTETLSFASPIIVDENTPRYIAARTSARFADKNSEKNVLVLKAEDAIGNPVEIPYTVLGVNSAGKASLKTSTGTTYARNDKLAEVTRHWNITTVIDIKDNVAYFFEGTTCHLKVNFDADIAKITGIEFSAEQTEANTALMYIDNIEVSQFDIDGEFNLGNTEFFVDDVKLDTSITSEGTATGKLSVASNGSKQSAKVIAAAYNDGSVESVKVYDLDFTGVLNKTYDLDFGTVTPGYVLKTFVWEAGTGLVPVRLPDILGNN